MASDSNAPINLWEDEKFWSSVQEDEEFWDRWSLNIYDRRLVKPMVRPLTAPWDLVVSDSDVQKLKAGYRSRNQDEKYDWLIEDENGNISIHIIRHFGRKEEYILHIAPKSSNGNSAGAKIHSITWNGESVRVEDDVELAKERAVILARAILGCDLENAPRAA